MGKKYALLTEPFVVPTTDDKLIQEFAGLASTGETKVSIANMVAPPGWSEPAQTPEFDEYTIMVRGRKKVIIDGEELEICPGCVLKVSAGAQVQYSNPFNEDAEYWSVCLPAFSPDTVHRENS